MGCLNPQCHVISRKVNKIISQLDVEDNSYSREKGHQGFILLSPLRRWWDLVGKISTDLFEILVSLFL
jgi:hypothetical protein